jgi:hypothetical protein
LPPPSLSICDVTPITRPCMSSSAPPELPWLIAASVWIESSIVKPFGAVCWRWRALMMPHVTVFWSPNGLPIATAPSPTWTSSEFATASGWSFEGEDVHVHDREVGRGVAADERALGGRAVGEADGDRRGAVDHVLVGDDVALHVVDPAGTLRLLRLAAAAAAAEGEAVRARAGRAGRDGQLDDPGRGVAVDLVHGQAAALGSGVLRDGDRPDDGRGAALGAGGGHDGQRGAGRREHGGPGECE